jgi:DNA-binding GntR family transcriptional regulator
MSSSNLSIERLAPVRDQVADRLRDAIVSMEMKPGQLLVERELCEATTASRASVREALRRLESEGLVVSEPGKGTRVAVVSAEEAVHLYEVRAVLEGLAGRLFAERATDEQASELERAVTEIEQVVEDPPKMLLAKVRFYEALFAGTGNPELRQLLDRIHRRVTLMRASSLSVPGRPAESVREMRSILEAAMRHDGDATAELCAAHVRAAAAAGVHAADGGLADPGSGS